MKKFYRWFYNRFIDETLIGLAKRFNYTEEKFRYELITSMIALADLDLDLDLDKSPEKEYNISCYTFETIKGDIKITVEFPKK
jgi:hypothetical protein